jgi:hypothetical protein
MISMTDQTQRAIRQEFREKPNLEVASSKGPKPQGGAKIDVDMQKPRSQGAVEQCEI